MAATSLPQALSCLEYCNGLSELSSWVLSCPYICCSLWRPGYIFKTTCFCHLPFLDLPNGFSSLAGKRSKSLRGPRVLCGPPCPWQLGLSPSPALASPCPMGQSSPLSLPLLDPDSFLFCISAQWSHSRVLRVVAFVAPCSFVSEHWFSPAVSCTVTDYSVGSLLVCKSPRAGAGTFSVQMSGTPWCLAHGDTWDVFVEWIDFRT